MNDKNREMQVSARVRSTAVSGVSVEYAEAALHSLSAGVIMQLATGEIVTCNPSAERLLGLTRDQIARKTSLDPVWNMIHEDGSPFPGETHPSMVTLATGHALRDVVMGVCRSDGSFVWVSINTEPILGPDGRPAAVVITFHDITDRKREAEEALGRSEDDLRYVFEHSVVGMSMTFPSGEVLVNGAFARMLGYDAADLAGARWRDFTHPDDVEDSRTHVASLLSGHQDAFHLTKRYVRRDGSVVWADVWTSLRRDAAGRSVFFVTNAIDITERMAAEAELRRNATLLALAQHSARAGTWYWDMTSGRLDWSPEMFSLFGLSPAKDVATFDAWRGTLHPDDRQAAERRIEDAIRRREFLDSEYRIVRPDGETLWIQALGETEYDPSGQPVWMAGLCMNVTDRKRAEDEARQLNAELEMRVAERTEDLRKAMAYNRSLIEASVDPLMTIGRDGRILDVNEATVRATGVPREELVGTDFPRYFTEADRARAGYEKAFSEGTVRDYELQLERKGAPPVPVDLNATVFRDSNGAVQGVFASARDLSVRQEFEAQLAKANSELESFSYSVSHDLRAPLRAIEGFSGMLVRNSSERLNAEDKRLLDIVRANALRMSALIDDLLSFSRLGRHEVRHARLEMTSIARSAIEEILKDSEARERIEFRLGELPDAEGDPALLRHVWINLLSNALKFSARQEKPAIEVAGVPDGSFAVYHVRDNGAGFDPKYASKLFAVFQRLHSLEEFEGTGIGLALVKRIVEKHGGRTWAEGEVGRGATFWFSLPLLDRSSGDGGSGIGRLPKDKEPGRSVGAGFRG